LKLLRYLSILALVGLARPSSAEIQFLAKQYTRCAACHYNPSGGSLLTPYGRSLSREEISTWGRSAEEEVGAGTEEHSLYGLLGAGTRPLDVGIDLRPTRLEISSSHFEMTRDFLMRADVQVAFRKDRWTAYAEVGRQPTEPATFISREHWLMYQEDDGLGVKVGRFLPAFGLRLAEHTALNRRNLGFDQDDQVYGIELTDTRDNRLVQFSFGPGRAESLLDDDGNTSFTATGRVQWELGRGKVLALSGLYRGATDHAPQQWMGNVAIGWSPAPRLSIWTELNTRVAEGWKGTPEYVVFNETSFELYRGVWLKFSPQLSTELGNVSGGLSRWSLGAQLFPRAHWNVNVSWLRDGNRITDTTVDTLVLQLHIYL